MVGVLAMAAAAAAPPPVKGYEIEVNLSISLRLCGAGERWSRLWVLEAERGTWEAPRLWPCVEQLLGCVVSSSRDRSGYGEMFAGTGQLGFRITRPVPRS